MAVATNTMVLCTLFSCGNLYSKNIQGKGKAAALRSICRNYKLDFKKGATHRSFF
ncbi:hypothetical protein [Labilibaculum euxinus]